MWRVSENVVLTRQGRNCSKQPLNKRICAAAIFGCSKFLLSPVRWLERERERQRNGRRGRTPSRGVASTVGLQRGHSNLQSTVRYARSSPTCSFLSFLHLIRLFSLFSCTLMSFSTSVVHFLCSFHHSFFPSNELCSHFLGGVIM